MGTTRFLSRRGINIRPPSVHPLVILNGIVCLSGSAMPQHLPESDGEGVWGSAVSVSFFVLGRHSGVFLLCDTTSGFELVGAREVEG